MFQGATRTELGKITSWGFRSHSTSLYPRFLIFRIEIIIVHVLQKVVVKSKQLNTCEALISRTPAMR